MKNREGVTAGGTWVVDYTKTVARFPEPGECTLVVGERVGNGGAPYNVLVDLRRLEAPFPLRAVGRVGRDLDGSNVLKDCLAHDVDTKRLVSVSDAPTSFSDVMVGMETGARTSFNHPGANACLMGEDFELDEDRSRILYIGSLFFLKALDQTHPRHGTELAKLLSRARALGMQTCVDIERTAHVSHEEFLHGCQAALRHTDFILLNIEIAERLTGRALRQPVGVDLAACEKAARELASAGEARLVVLRFPSGALATDTQDSFVAEGSFRIPKSRIVSASGAGHAFTAGVLYGCHEGWDTRRSLLAGHAAAAASLMDVTASGGIRPLPECLQLCEKYGQRVL